MSDPSDMERIHVYPENDALVHNTDGPLCWCNPLTEYVMDNGYLVGIIYTHTAADGRATQERQFLSGAN